jgi:DnaJ-like protein
MRSAFIAIRTAVTGVTAISAAANGMQLTHRAGARQGRGPLNCLPLPRLRADKLTIHSCHGGLAGSVAAKTLYDLLGARPDDDADGLKNAFRKAVKANHPDLHPGDPDATVRLSGIVRAYAILRDTQERASYDRALEFEREPLRTKPKRTVFDTMHNILSAATVVAVLAVALGGGYVLLADVLTKSVEGVKVVEMTASGSAKIAAVQPAARTATTEREDPRDKLEGVVVPSIAIVPSAAAAAAKSGDALGIANDRPAPSLPEQDVEVTKVIEDTSAPIDQADARTVSDQLRKSDGVERPDQNQSMAPSVGAGFSSLENGNSIPKSSSSDFTISDQKHHMKAPDAKAADMKAADMKIPGKPRAGAIRQTLSHAPFKQASIENKDTSACSESRSCSGRESPLLGVGF